ncbi:MAG: hypothetical protein RLZZ165_2076 [Bacteroidota bacterium]
MGRLRLTTLKVLSTFFRGGTVLLWGVVQLSLGLHPDLADEVVHLLKRHFPQSTENDVDIIQGEFQLEILNRIHIFYPN